MAAATSNSVTPRGPRLLLFGLPGSGKSSLLGAFAQADALQAPALKGRLTDPTGRLEALRASTYSENFSPTPDEVVAYPVQLVPAEGSSALTFTLLDCDGQAAQPYLAGEASLTATDSPLARAMLRADTVILPVDASAAGDQLDAQLEQFRRFLELLREARGQRADVADLPVYLVLTKSDRLARPGETFGHWVQRLEEAKRRLDSRFRDLLAANIGSAFGSLDLHIWATAVRRPAGTEHAGQGPEPYGVAELFRQAIESAEDFRGRRTTAGSRLGLTALGLASLLGLLGVLAVVFTLGQPDPELNRLRDEVRIALPFAPDASAVERLRGPLDARLKQLRAIEQDPDFAHLPETMRRDVSQARAEIEAYLRANDRLQEQVKKPYLAKNEAEFVQFEKQLRAFQLPLNYADEWGETRLVQRLDQVRREYANARQALAEEEAWIRDRAGEGRALLKRGATLYGKLQQEEKPAPAEVETWSEALRQYLQPRVRVPGHERIPGVSALTYDDLSKFTSVRQARKDWHAVKDELEKLHNLIESRMAQ